MRFPIVVRFLKYCTNWPKSPLPILPIVAKLVVLLTNQKDYEHIKQKGVGLAATHFPVNFYGLTPVAFAATGLACPPLADNFIYGYTPAGLRRNTKSIGWQYHPDCRISPMGMVANARVWLNTYFGSTIRCPAEDDSTNRSVWAYKIQLVLHRRLAQERPVLSHTE